MQTRLEVLFTPAEYETLPGRDLSQTVCVVFDVFRASTTIVTALANGATAIIPVAEISDALALRRQNLELLLAGERDGLRIHAGLTGGIDFDFGNSPREFISRHVLGRSIALSTTNGTRALRACAHAKEVLVGSFLNLGATADHVQRSPDSRVLLVCSGTGRHAAYEDLLGAGALAERLLPHFTQKVFSDSANAALEIYQLHSRDLLNAIGSSRNGRRLLSIPDLRDDVPWCLQRDRFPLVAKLVENSVTKLSP